MKEKINEFIFKASLYRSGHYDACRYYTVIERYIAMPSVIFSAAILGFAFYSVDRENAPLWIQYSLAILSIIQGSLVAVSTYLRPAALAEQYRQSAVQFGNIMRDYESLILKIDSGTHVNIDDIEAIMSKSAVVSKQSKELPKHIIKVIREEINVNKPVQLTANAATD